MNPIRWGIMATGWIAEQMACAINDQPDAELIAVASRSQEKADQFGQTWRIPRRYPTYQALAADPDIDIIYIATPHNLHYENMTLCLNAGKHVLCEKPFTINAQQAREIIHLAREKNRFVMEALWTRFIPGVQQALDWINEGVIGDVRLVQAHFSVPIPYDPQARLYAPELAGGALLDMGIYPISIAYMALGRPDKIMSHAHLCETGVDELNSAIFIYHNGAQATLNSSQRLNRPAETFINGSKGHIKLHHMFLNCQKLSLQIGRDGEEQIVNVPFAGNGYIHQIREVHDCLRAGKIESDKWPLASSHTILEIMDEMRHSWGVIYPDEKASFLA